MVYLVRRGENSDGDEQIPYAVFSTHKLAMKYLDKLMKKMDKEDKNWMDEMEEPEIVELELDPTKVKKL